MTPEEHRPAKAGWPVDLGDVVAVAGVAIAAYGFWLVYPPLTFIFSGLALAVSGALIAVKKAKY